MEQYQQVTGLILRSRDYKEADQLLTVYTHQQGKLTVQARGVKKTASKLRGGLLLFSQVDLVLAAGKGFPVVTSASAVHLFTALRADFARMSYASYAAELIDQTVAEGQPDESLFRLALQVFHLLEHVDPWLAVRLLEVRLLEQQGYGLQLDCCLSCGAPLCGERFQTLQGGLLCAACAAGRSGEPLTQEGLTVLRALDIVPLHRLGWVYVSQEGRQSVEQYLELQLQQLLRYPLKTKDVLRQLRFSH